MNWHKIARKTFIFFLLNAVVSLLISTRYLNNIDSVTWISGSFITVASIGHFFAITSLLFLVLLLPIRVGYKYPKVLNTICILIGSFAQTVLCIDTFVYQLYRFHINGFVLGLVFGEGAGEIFQIGTQTYITATAVILGIVGLESLLLFIAKKIANKEAKSAVRRIAYTGLSFILITNISFAYADAIMYRPIMKAKFIYPLFYPLTAKSFIYKYIVDREKINHNPEIHLSKNREINYPKEEIVTQKAKTNIIVIMIDSWHHQCMTPKITPNIYNFSTQNLEFKNHYSGSNGTRGSVFGFFYGIPALYWDDMKTGEISPVFFNTLKKYGYNIQTFPSATLRYPEFDQTVFLNIDNLNIKTKGKKASDRDIQITKNFIQYIKDKNNTKDPFFSFIFYDSAHAIAHPKDYKGPFSPEWKYPKYEKLSNDLNREKYFNLYKNTLHFVDNQVKEVIEEIKKQQLLDNTMIVITGDHGQEFNDNHKNYWGHGGNFTEFQTQIPMIIHIPGVEHRSYEHFTTHYDFVPTMMQDIFHCKTKTSSYSVGKNFFSEEDRMPIVMGTKTNFAFREKDRITCVNYDGTYDLTDLSLNPLEEESIHAKALNSALKITNQYYGEQ
ncbi:DUF3413 domain-containing protein [Halosquirtibacter laminarini]|uniref:DUF3413 domain-containing protein n=1 Tax=Halosquirtibacter laminarini TaxID=3374600 RepID=A0AC61NC14_9BACT|nr:DUF3413 domain-containing protein [Prolixibacteraceae bacterium]